MTEKERRKGGGSKLSRSETVTVRLDPKLRYLAELAARQQRRTVSSFIEWAIEEILSQMPLNPKGKSSSASDDTIMSGASGLWDVEEADRFAKLAFRHEHLLTHDEQILWKLVCENGWLWRGRYDEDNEWAWYIRESSLIWARLRDNWELFKAVAAGEAGKDVLPTWIKKKEEEATFNPDDEIPF